MSAAKTQPEVRTRFAPSPSGHLHVGGARTALFNWAFARHHGGTFIVRIEDTDQKRSSGAASVGFLKDLKWLGIEWDEGPEFEGVGGGAFGPYFQSERLETYRQYADKLIAAGRAYRAWETSEELEALRQSAKNEGVHFEYHRDEIQQPDQETQNRYLREGRPFVVRVIAPQFVPPPALQCVTFKDEVVGTVTLQGGLTKYGDDFVIMKADGYPTYHFAVVIDDELMRVTHVIRAQEHLNNTGRHIILQEALGFSRPVYAHVSVIFNPDGSKMSKRDKAKAVRAEARRRLAEGKLSPKLKELEALVARGLLSRAGLPRSAPLDHDAAIAAFYNGDIDQLEIAELFAEYLDFQLPEINIDDFRRAGYLPDVLVNYLALLGWNPGGDVEKFDADFFVQHFSMERIIKSPAKFDRAKLLAFNLDALQAMPPDDFVERLREHGAEFHPEYMERFQGERFDLFARCNQSRSKTLEDPFRSCRFMLMPDELIQYEDSKPVRKALEGGEPSGLALLERVLPVLEAQRDWSHTALEAAVKQFADQHAGGNLGKIAQPLRIAVSGGVVSPAIFETLSLIGKNSVINRIKRCLAWRREGAVTS